VALPGINPGDPARVHIRAFSINPRAQGLSMEAYVWSGTGLLPKPIDTVRLTTLEDGRWQARCESESGDVRTLQFDSGEDAQSQVAGALRSQFGFASAHAAETARRLFEPFEMVADWPW
jgi:hypothetical protein